MAETITVQIHGSEYKLRGEDAERVMEAARLVNDQMQFVSSRAPTQPVATVAVLAALNTAELLMNEQDRVNREAADIARRLDTMTATIEEMLGSE